MQSALFLARSRECAQSPFFCFSLLWQPAARIRRRLQCSRSPRGAYLTEKGTGKVFGVAPQTVLYDASMLANHKGADDCFRVKGFDARWVSGAVAGLEVVRLCGGPSGTWNITFTRDPNLPDLDKDLQFALQLQATRAQQQQARAAQDAANAANAALYRNLFQPPRRPVNCTSTQVGNTVQTNCY